MTTQKTYRIGNTTVTRIPDLEIKDSPEHLYPQRLANLAQETKEHFSDPSWDRKRNALRLSVHSWLVRTPNHTLIIDTAAGNDKPRPLTLMFDHLEMPYLEHLESAGLRPEQVDYVRLTHLHSQVGWNTQRVDRVWRPAFRNARYVMPKKEYTFYREAARRHEVRQIILEDSVYPVVNEGWPSWLATRAEKCFGCFRWVPTAGHSIGLMSLLLESAGERALFGGDVMHHPVQVYRPEMNSIYCEQGELAYESRRAMLEVAAAKDVLYCSTHFPETSAGRITRTGAGFAWRYE